MILNLRGSKEWDGHGMYFGSDWQGASVIHSHSTCRSLCFLVGLQNFSSLIPCSCPAYHCTFTLTLSSAVPVGKALLLEATSNFLFKVRNFFVLFFFFDENSSLLETVLTPLKTWSMLLDFSEAFPAPMVLLNRLLFSIIYSISSKCSCEGVCVCTSWNHSKYSLTAHS